MMIDAAARAEVQQLQLGWSLLTVNCKWNTSFWAKLETGGDSIPTAQSAPAKNARTPPELGCAWNKPRFDKVI